MTLRHWSQGVIAVVLVVILAGCGGASSPAAAGASSQSGAGSQSGSGSLSGNSGGGNTGGSQPIQGIATPQSVSVVTATNAN